MIAHVSIALCGLLLTSPRCDSSPMRMERVSASKTEMRKADLEMSASEYLYGHRHDLPASSYVRYTDHGNGRYRDASEPMHYAVDADPVSLGGNTATTAAPVAHVAARRTTVLPRYAPALLLAYNEAPFSTAPETAASIVLQSYATDDTANYNGAVQLTEHAAPLAAPKTAENPRAPYYNSPTVDGANESERYDESNEDGRENHDRQDNNDDGDDDHEDDDDGNKDDESGDENENNDDDDDDNDTIEKSVEYDKDDEDDDRDDDDDDGEHDDDEDGDSHDDANSGHPETRTKNFGYHNHGTPKKFVLLEFDLPSKVIGELGSSYSDAAVGYKAGSGRSYDAEQYSTHGRNDEEDYKSRHKFDTRERGKHYKDGQTGHYGETGLKKNSHLDEAHAQGKHYEESDGDDSENFGHSSSYKRGQKTTGFHNVYRKDDYKKNTDFYDDDYKAGHFNKHDVFDKHHNSADASFKRVENKDVDFSDRANGKKGHYDKGHQRSHERGHELEKDAKSYHEDYSDYASKSHRNSSKEHGYKDH